MLANHLGRKGEVICLTNNNDDDSFDWLGSGWSVPKCCGPKPRELRVDALSSEEWNYLHGLFFADGSSFIRRRLHQYCVKFSFQGNEVELARRVVVMTRKIGLNPHVYGDRHKNMFNVIVLSMSLFSFLPSKARLLLDQGERERFFESNRLYEVRFGIPFLAGLLDGDGACWVTKPRTRLRSLNKWNWNFAQGKYAFLIEYVRRFVESLAKGSTAERVIPTEVVEIRFRKAGIIALLNKGIGDYSWKVAWWLEKCDSFRSGRAKYCTARNVARMLGLSQNFVIKWWLKGGKRRYE